MAFHCVSRVGLTIGSGYLPKEIQELIANFWLPNRYREKYDDVMRELVVELAVGSAMPINNIEPTKVQILLSEFDDYDKNTMQTIMKYFVDAIYWHSTTRIINLTRSELYSTPHESLLRLSYQDLLALRYYIDCVYKHFNAGKKYKNLFTNTWFPPRFDETLGIIIFPWMQQ